MSELQSHPSRRAKFTLKQLLSVIGLLVLGFAIHSVRLRNKNLLEQRDQLQAFSSELHVTDERKLTGIALPKIVDRFHSWDVFVPSGTSYKLRFGIGKVKHDFIPNPIASIPLAAGRHRITLGTGDNPEDEYRYRLFVDGNLVFDHSMGREWMPQGRQGSTSLRWPTNLSTSSQALQLSSAGYELKQNFGPGPYITHSLLEGVSRLGYRLWIDQSNQTYPPASPFICDTASPLSTGIGFGDGLRYVSTGYSPLAKVKSGQWWFSYPRLSETQIILQLESEFFAADGRVLSSSSTSLRSWQLRKSAHGPETVQWQHDPAVTAQVAYLHGVTVSQDDLKPIIELKWDTARPDEVGIRLADVPANRPIQRWRLRILDGAEHLWRELKDANQSHVTAIDAMRMGLQSGGQGGLSTNSVLIPITASDLATASIEWATTESQPLTMVQANVQQYARMSLHRGYPVKFGLQLPISAKPQLALEVDNSHPTLKGSVFPGGPIFKAVVVEMDAQGHDWIWLSATPK